MQPKPNCLLLFEIIDTAKSADIKQHIDYTSESVNSNWQRIAWAFLKVSLSKA